MGKIRMVSELSASVRELIYDETKRRKSSLKSVCSLCFSLFMHLLHSVFNKRELCRGDSVSRPKARIITSEGVSAPRVDTTGQTPLQNANLQATCLVPAEL